MTLEVKLEPFLINDDYLDGISTFTPKYDRLIKQRIADDYTHVKGIFTYYYKVVDYVWKDPYIIVTLQPKSGKRFAKNELIKIRDEIVDPDNVGPDTWMEGDITILSEDEARKTKRFKNSNHGVELGVRVVI